MSIVVSLNNSYSQTNNLCILFEIPRDIYNDICSSWLSVKDLGVVDIVVSDRVYRMMWHEVLNSRTVLTLHVEEVWNVIRGSNTIRFIDWINVRKLKLTKIVLDNECFSDSNVLLCRIKYCDVQELIVRDVSHDVSVVVNACTNLTSFSFELCIGSVNNLCPTVLAQLTHLKLFIAGAPYEHVRLHCRKLECLIVCGTAVEEVETIVDIIASNPNLHEMDVSGDALVLEAIFEHCKILSYICFSSTDYFPANIIRKYQHRWIQMSEFCILSNDNEVTYRVNDMGKVLLLVDIKSWEPQYNFLFQLNGIQKLKLINTDILVNEAFLRSNRTFLSFVRIDNSSVSLDMLEYILKFPHIEKLIFVDSGNFDCSAVTNLFIKAPSVVQIFKLSLNPFSLNDLFAMIKVAPNLQRLHIFGCDLSDVDMVSVMEYLTDLKCKGRLVSVSVN